MRLLSLWKHIRKLFTWHSLSNSPFPLLLFVCAAQRAPLPWHLSAFFIGSFIMWPFPTLWVCRYNFPLYQWFYGWLWSLLHPEGLFPSESDWGPFFFFFLFGWWLPLKERNRLESGVDGLICLSVILDLRRHGQNKRKELPGLISETKGFHKCVCVTFRLCCSHFRPHSSFHQTGGAFQRHARHKFSFSRMATESSYVFLGLFHCHFWPGRVLLP